MAIHNRHCLFYEFDVGSQVVEARRTYVAAGKAIMSKVVCAHSQEERNLTVELLIWITDGNLL